MIRPLLTKIGVAALVLGIFVVAGTPAAADRGGRFRSGASFYSQPNYGGYSNRNPGYGGYSNYAPWGNARFNYSSYGYNNYPSRGYYPSTGYYPTRGYNPSMGYYSSAGYYPTTAYYPSTAYSYAPSYVTPSTDSSYSSYYQPTSNTLPTTNAAVLDIRVPANAELWMQDQQMSVQGMNNQFSSPPLTQGQNYSYDVRARWFENGTPVERTRRVIVRAGDRVTVDLTTR